MQRPSPRFLEQRGLRMLVFIGKGGVGKTTCATACALHLALRSPGDSFLLVSTDPAHSLADSLGDMTPPGNLQVLELDAERCLDAFRAQNSRPLEEIAAAGTFLDDEDIHRFLSLSLPGLDELMAFLEISGWVDTGRYSCIVVDTAPSGHAMRLLEIPQLLFKWIGMLDLLLAKRRYMRRVFAHSGRRDRLDSYLADWKVRLRAVESLLLDPLRSQFIPVTIAEPMSVQETMDLLCELQHRKVPVPELIVNQLRPSGRCNFCSEMRVREWTQLRRLRTMPGAVSISIWGMDLLEEEVRGREHLLNFWTRTWPLGSAVEPSENAVPACPGELESPALQLASSLELVIFSGKGGVGKTTLACATAVHFAEARPHSRVLLLSTDPAHSTSECLQTGIGPSPVSILPNLSAMEIDAAAEFAALKEQYAQDIEAFLGAWARGFDMPFDRAVLEQLMDLAPPGLDEVMALMRMISIMGQDRYDLFLLDSASTGHLIRLLEMPDLVDQWLKAFFRLFLKYENILRLPRFSGRLVDLSKSLKTFRRLMVDPQRAALCAVGIPTWMALDETTDLLATCRRMGIAVPAIFLNLLTPPNGECRLCSRLMAREALVAQAFERAFPGPSLSRVNRQGAVAGIEAPPEVGTRLVRAKGSRCLCILTRRQRRVPPLTRICPG